LTLPLAFNLIPPGIHHVWLFLVLGSLSAMLVSLGKAGFGASIGVLSFPIMVYACGGNSLLAVAVTLPLLIACDLVAMASWWGRWNGRAAGLLLPGAVLGIILGGLCLWAIRGLDGSSDQATRARANAALMLIVGLIALGFVAMQAARWVGRKPLVFRPGPWQGAGVGAAAGITSTLAHAAGPVVAMYLLPQQLPKSAFVATTVLFYAIINLLKLVPYSMLGLINTQTLGAALALLPAVVGGTAAGLLLHGRVDQRQFNGVVYVLLALAGGRMVYQGAVALWWR